MESQPQNPEFRNNPENFHPCDCKLGSNADKYFLQQNCINYSVSRLKVTPVFLFLNSFKLN